MITKEEVKNLADLARIKLSEEETEKLTREVDSILEYVGQIQELSGEVKDAIPEHRNVMRDDVVTNTEGEYTEKILESAPDREGQLLRVKKILG